MAGQHRRSNALPNAAWGFVFHFPIPIGTGAHMSLTAGIVAAACAGGATWDASRPLAPAGRGAQHELPRTATGMAAREEKNAARSAMIAA